MSQRDRLKQMRRCVVKIGSALLTNDGQGLDMEAMSDWVDQMAELRRRGIDVVLVSSGSVAEGMSRLGWETRPHALHELQAAAAVGQMGLVRAYENCFKKRGYHTAQILLTHEDLSSRTRYLNARSTLRTLLELGVIPVINENDTVATDEIRFGDNDTLGALVANLVEADCVVLLTDQDGLYEADPRFNPEAKLIQEAGAHDPTLDAMAGDSGSGQGTGGMRTKVNAARLAARSGAACVIVSGRIGDVLPRVADGEQLGTLLIPDDEPQAARKQWLAGQMQVSGKLWLDDGAVRSLQEQGRSLLSVGVTGAEGDFQRGDVVVCLDKQGKEIARGLVNYSADETHKILGVPTSGIEAVLGYLDEAELIHRDNLVLV